MLDAPTTNAQWLAAAKDLADHKTWEQLSATYRTPILHHCAKSGLTPQEAEEIVQEAFAQLAVQTQKCEGPWEPKTLRAWLTDVVNRYIIDYHKNAPRRHLSPNVMALVQQWMESRETTDLSSAERLENESHLWVLSLNRAKSQVSPQHWQIFDAYAIQGLSSREVAQRFNTSHFNVRLIAHRIKKVARNAYNQLLSEEIDLSPP